MVSLDEMVTPGSPLHTREVQDSRVRGTGLGVFRGERMCAAAIARLTLPYERLVVDWVQGFHAVPDARRADLERILVPHISERDGKYGLPGGRDTRVVIVRRG